MAQPRAPRPSPWKGEGQGGGLAAVASVFVAALIGVPFFYWFQSTGLDVTHLSETTMPVKDKILLDIRAIEVFYSTVIVVGVMILVAWAPARRISRLDPTLALRGRGIT